MQTTISKIEINSTASKVWTAITDAEMVKQWQYGSVLTTSWEPGTSIRFSTEWGDDVFEQWGTVIEFDPEKTLKYSLFSPRDDLLDSPENYFFMTYSLQEAQGSTVLSIIQDDPRPQALPQESVDEEQGNTILKGLKDLIERN